MGIFYSIISNIILYIYIIFALEYSCFWLVISSFSFVPVKTSYFHDFLPLNILFFASSSSFIARCLFLLFLFRSNVSISCTWGILILFKSRRQRLDVAGTDDSRVVPNSEHNLVYSWFQSIECIRCARLVRTRLLASGKIDSGQREVGITRGGRGSKRRREE